MVRVLVVDDHPVCRDTRAGVHPQTRSRRNSQQRRHRRLRSRHPAGRWLLRLRVRARGQLRGTPPPCPRSSMISTAAITRQDLSADHRLVVRSPVHFGVGHGIRSLVFRPISCCGAGELDLQAHGSGPGRSGFLFDELPVDVDPLSRVRQLDRPVVSVPDPRITHSEATRCCAATKYRAEKGSRGLRVGVDEGERRCAAGGQVQSHPGLPATVRGARRPCPFYRRAKLAAAHRSGHGESEDARSRVGRWGAFVRCRPTASDRPLVAVFPEVVKRGRRAPALGGGTRGTAGYWGARSPAPGSVRRSPRRRPPRGRWPA